MQFEDPQPFNCPHCGAAQVAPVKLLLALTVNCENCERDVSAVGLRMREYLNAWSTFSAKVELAVALERKFAVTVPDEDLEKSGSIEELASAIRLRHPNSGITASAVAAEALSVLSGLGSLRAPVVLRTSNFYEMFSKHGFSDDA